MTSPQTGIAAPARRSAPEPKQPSRSRHRRAAEQAVDRNSTRLRFHVGDAEVTVTLPPPDRLAFYAGLAGAAAFGVVEWPVALLTGVGHLLADDRHNRALRALGEALDAV